MITGPVIMGCHVRVHYIKVCHFMVFHWRSTFEHNNAGDRIVVVSKWVLCLRMYIHYVRKHPIHSHQALSLILLFATGYTHSCVGPFWMSSCTISER